MSCALEVMSAGLRLALAAALKRTPGRCNRVIHVDDKIAANKLGLLAKDPDGRLPHWLRLFAVTANISGPSTRIMSLTYTEPGRCLARYDPLSVRTETGETLTEERRYLAMAFLIMPMTASKTPPPTPPLATLPMMPPMSISAEPVAIPSMPSS